MYQPKVVGDTVVQTTASSTYSATQPRVDTSQIVDTNPRAPHVLVRSENSRMTMACEDPFATGRVYSTRSARASVTLYISGLHRLLGGV